MKSKSKSPFWVHSPLEESYCKVRMYKYLDQSDCEISIFTNLCNVDHRVTAWAEAPDPYTPVRGK